MISAKNLASEITFALEQGDCLYDNSLFKSLIRDIDKLKDVCTETYQENLNGQNQFLAPNMRAIHTDDNGEETEVVIIAVIEIKEAISKDVVGDIKFLVQSPNEVHAPIMCSRSALKPKQYN